MKQFNYILYMTAASFFTFKNEMEHVNPLEDKISCIQVFTTKHAWKFYRRLALRFPRAIYSETQSPPTAAAKYQQPYLS